MNTISLVEMLACARRELALRTNVYPRWIQAGRMTQEKAKHEIDCMAAIVNQIEKCRLLEEVSNEILAAEEKRKALNEQPQLPLT